MLVSSGITLTHTPRNNVSLNSWTSCSPVKRPVKFPITVFRQIWEVFSEHFFECSLSSVLLLLLLGVDLLLLLYGTWCVCVSFVCVCVSGIDPGEGA